jgi:hypothetical protein
VDNGWILLLPAEHEHTGFNAYCGPRILPWHKKVMENLARYTCPPLEDHLGLFFPRKNDLEGLGGGCVA